ncbi:MAG: hypothetical protein ABI615_11285 [Chthoniobacterales bacterium]
MKSTNPLLPLVAIAATQLTVRETSTNQGPGIAKYWKDTNYPTGYAERQPYCAAGISWVVAEASRGGIAFALDHLPNFAAVVSWRDWAAKMSQVATAPRVQVFKPRNAGLFPQAGDIVHLLPHTSHIELVESFDGRTVHTIGFNTDVKGGREGDGVYRRVRKYDFCGAFIRLPVKPS